MVGLLIALYWSWSVEDRKVTESNGMVHEFASGMANHGEL